MLPLRGEGWTLTGRLARARSTGHASLGEEGGVCLQSPGVELVSLRVRLQAEAVVLRDVGLMQFCLQSAMR